MKIEGNRKNMSVSFVMHWDLYKGSGHEEGNFSTARPELGSKYDKYGEYLKTSDEHKE